MFWLIVIAIVVCVVVFIGFTIADTTTYRVMGGKQYNFDIVGEASYQSALAAIAGAKGEVGKRFECMAVVIPETTNKHDKNAIQVIINRKLVGYFDRESAKKFHQYMQKNNISRAGFIVDAIIVGGWIDDGGEGSYGVKLDAPLDFNQWQLEKLGNNKND